MPASAAQLACAARITKRAEWNVWQRGKALTQRAQCVLGTSRSTSIRHYMMQASEVAGGSPVFGITSSGRRCAATLRSFGGDTISPERPIDFKTTPPQSAA